jgi:cytochrome P450 family 6
MNENIITVASYSLNILGLRFFIMETKEFLMILVSIASGLVGVLYLYLAYVYTYWKKRNVPFSEPRFPTGNALDIIRSRKTMGEIYKDWYRKFSGCKFAGLYQIYRPVLLLMDTDLIKNTLVRDFEHFQDRGFPVDEDNDPLAANLIRLNGDKWKTLRSKLTPTFTPGKLKMMFHTLVECGQNLEKCFEEHAHREDIIELKDILARFTTDVIASCAFGIQCNCLRNPNAEFRRWGRKLFEPSLNQNLRDILYFMVPTIAVALKVTINPPDIANFFTKVVEDTVEYRERNNVTHNDFMELLIQLKSQGCLDTDNQGNGRGQSEYHFKLY